jgi:hypothetical protein
MANGHGGKRTPKEGSKPAHRPKGSRNKKKAEIRKLREEGMEEGESPGDFMVRIMRDESQPIERRIQCAQYSAPYLHSRMPQKVVGEFKAKHVVEVTQREAGVS